MAGEALDEAFVDILPRIDDVAFSRIGAKAEKALGDAGKKAGEALTEGIERPLAKLPEKTNRAATAFERALTGAARRAAAALDGSINPEIAKIEKELLQLASKPIDLEFTAEQAEAELKRLQTRLQQLQSGDLTLDAKFNTGAALKEIGALDRAFDDIDKAAAGSFAKVEAAATKSGGKLSSVFQSTGAQIAGAFAGVEILSRAFNFVTTATAAAGDLNETLSATKAILGEAGAAAADEFAKGAADAIGQSRQQALDAIGTFAAFGKGAGLSGQALSDFGSKFTVLASDLASFKNTSPEQAIEAIGAALRGEAEPIRAYNVLINDAAIKAEAVSSGLVQAAKDTDKIKVAQVNAIVAQKAYGDAVAKSGKDSLEAQKASGQLAQAQATLKKVTEGTVPELSAQQKVLATSQLIFKQTKDAQGDFAKTSTGLANSQRILKARFADLSANIGRAFLPAALAIVTVLNKVIDVVGKVGPAIGSITGFVEDNAVAFGLLGGVVLLATARIIANTAATIASAAATKAVAIATRAYAAAQFVLNAALTANPIGLVIAGIALLVAGILLAYKNSETFRKVVDKVGAALKGAFLAALKGIQAAFKFLLPAITAVGNFLKANFLATMRAVQVIVGVVSKVLQALGKVFNVVSKVILVVIAISLIPLIAVIRRVIAIVQVAGSIISTVFNKVRSVIAAVVSYVIARLLSLAQSVVSVFSSIVTFIAGVMTTIATFIRNGVNRWLEIVRTGLNAIVNAFSNIASRIAAFIQPVVSRVTSIFRTVFSAARAVITSGVSSLASAFGAIVGKVLSIGGKLYNAGRTVIGKLVSGLSSVGGVAGNIASGVGNALRGVVNSIVVNPLNNGIASVENAIRKIPGAGGINIPRIPQLALGAILNKPTVALVAEDGPEAVIPLDPKKRRRRNQLLRMAGLPTPDDGPSGGGPRGYTPPAPPSGKQITNHYHQQFNLLPGGDPETHAVQFAARVASGSER